MNDLTEPKKSFVERFTTLLNINTLRSDIYPKPRYSDQTSLEFYQNQTIKVQQIFIKHSYEVQHY